MKASLALNTAAHVPLTRPSHLSMFTGRYPSEHGIRDNISPSFTAPESRRWRKSSETPGSERRRSCRRLC